MGTESGVTTIQIVVDPWARGVVKGDLTATLDKCIMSFLSNEPGLPYLWDEWGCDEVAGYYFVLQHTDPDGLSEQVEKTVGEDTGRRTQIGQFPHKEKFEERHGEDTYEFVDTYPLVVHRWLRCVTPSMFMSAEKENLAIGEKTRITVELKCNDSAMVNESMHFSLIGPGMLESEETQTDLAGRAETIYHASKAGTAITIASYIHSTGKCKNETESISVLVGEKKTNISRISLLTFPEYLVTSGDGTTFMAGSGKVTIDDCSHHKRDYTTCKTEKIFKWEFRRNKKNK